MSIADQIGQRIRSVRESKGLGPEEMHKRSGISTSFIYQLEKNPKTNVILRRLEALALALEVSLSDLVNEKLSTEYILSSAALDAFCEEDKIGAQDKAYLRGLLDKGIFFSTPTNWKAHYRAWKSSQTRRPTLAELTRVAEVPQTY